MTEVKFNLFWIGCEVTDGLAMIRYMLFLCTPVSRYPNFRAEREIDTLATDGLTLRL